MGKYRIDVGKEMKYLALPSGNEIATEATECEMELWQLLEELRPKLCPTCGSESPNLLCCTDAMRDEGVYICRNKFHQLDYANLPSEGTGPTK